MFRIWWTLTAMVTVSLADDWKPVPKRHSSSVSYHGNIFPQHQIEDRYSKLNHLGSYESPLLSRFHHDFGPIQSDGSLIPAPEDDCGLYKVGFNQDLYFQYTQYKDPIPDLKEFTLCVWTKFHNHSNDHPLFNYAVGDNPKAITSWVSNTDRASYYSLAVAGHTFYRLNYPLRLNKWYHSCQSWNGRTGEWQIWVNAERVGRGFHNRLVGHVIKGGGIAISGQEQIQLTGSGTAPTDGKKSSRGTGGMLGELTMLQLYHVALTAGKAHKDHKHHHVHHFAHDGSPLPLTTPVPPTQPPNIQQGNSLVVGGQITPMLELNLGAAPRVVPAQLPNGLQLNQQYVNGQFGPGRAVSEQLFNARPQSLNPVQFGLPQSLSGQSGTRLVFGGQLAHPASVQYYESPSGHNLFKRGNQPEETKRNKRDNPEKELENLQAESDGENKKQIKRGLVALSDGSLVDDSLLDDTFEQSLLNGLAGLGENVPVQNIQKDKSDEREPAEAEVKAVMDLCTGCSEEPFQKAVVLSWRHSSKKLFGGAYYYPAVPACMAF